MSKIPVALQLYSVRDECARDFLSTLEAVAKMGYEGIEFAGFHGHSAEDVRAKCDELGLKVAGAHVAIDLLRGDALAETIEFHKTLGNQFLIIPWLDGETMQTRAAWMEMAEFVNDLALKLAPHEMRTGYHNHTFEFKPLPDGELPWDVFFGNTRDDVVMEFDTANALHAGAHATQFLEKYPNRATLVHLKEFSATNPDALLGEGDVPLREVMDICERSGGTKWYIVEHEKYPIPPLECVERGLRNLEKLR